MYRHTKNLRKAGCPGNGAMSLFGQPPGKRVKLIKPYVSLVLMTANFKEESIENMEKLLELQPGANVI